MHELADEYGLPPPDTLAAAMRIVAVFGGYLDRKNDPPPGSKVIWRGSSRLEVGAKTRAVIAKRYHMVCKEVVQRE